MNEVAVRRAYKKALSKGSLTNNNMVTNDSSVASFMEMLVDLAGALMMSGMGIPQECCSK